MRGPVFSVVLPRGRIPRSGHIDSDDPRFVLSPHRSGITGVLRGGTEFEIQANGERNCKRVERYPYRQHHFGMTSGRQDRLLFLYGPMVLRRSHRCGPALRIFLWPGNIGFLYPDRCWGRSLFGRNQQVPKEILLETASVGGLVVLVRLAFHAAQQQTQLVLQVLIAFHGKLLWKGDRDRPLGEVEDLLNWLLD